MTTTRPVSITGPDPDRAVGLFASALVEFDSRDAFIGHVKALERVGPYGLPGSGYSAPVVREDDIAEDAAFAAEAAPATTAAPSPVPRVGVAHSTTNVQEIGVDEPDVVKTDGNRILVLAYGILHYIDVSSGSPELHRRSVVELVGGGDNRSSVSRVDVLARDGRQLRVVGSVGGLGQGERIFAVRFIGEIGYIVTFRQTDPLYTVDFSDPENPWVVGELKILGYSAYLHSIGDGLLLGVGRDADERGWTLGTQVSVFDVSDLANPIRTHQFTLEDSYSDVEWDHRAFLYWPPKNMAVMPVSWWNYDDQSEYWDYFTGAFIFSVSAKGVEHRATLDHESVTAARLAATYKHEVYAQGEDGRLELVQGDQSIPEDDLRGLLDWPILRSLVVGDTLFTLPEGGLLGSDLDTFETTSWTGSQLRPTSLAGLSRMEATAFCLSQRAQ